MRTTTIRIDNPNETAQLDVTLTRFAFWVSDGDIVVDAPMIRLGFADRMLEPDEGQQLAEALTAAARTLSGSAVAS